MGRARRRFPETWEQETLRAILCIFTTQNTYKTTNNFFQYSDCHVCSRLDSLVTAASAVDSTPKICTPRVSPTPRINGPSIFGVRPGHRLFYHIPVSGERPMQYFAADLPVGSMAVGLFNLNDKDAATVTVKWSDLNLSGSRSVRDLWRQKNLGDFDDHISMNLAPHGAELIKIAP